LSKAVSALTDGVVANVSSAANQASDRDIEMNFPCASRELGIATQAAQARVGSLPPDCREL
jgi:hypothetical protein